MRANINWSTDAKRVSFQHFQQFDKAVPNDTSSIFFFPAAECCDVAVSLAALAAPGLQSSGWATGLAQGLQAGWRAKLSRQQGRGWLEKADGKNKYISTFDQKI